jgi:septum formation protein
MDNNLVLASSSPRRLDLLKLIDVVPNNVVSPEIDETPLKGEGALLYVKRMAKEKAKAVAGNFANSYVLSADTIVVRGSKILGKPNSKEEEVEFLKLLSGRRHSVFSAFCIVSPKNQCVLKVVKTAVVVKKLTEEEIRWYVDSKEWEGKSGGYAIQGKFQNFVKQINGSLSSVVGLPILEVYNSLLGLGYKIER